MKRYYQIVLSNSETWIIPAEIIAKSRAEYFSSLDYHRGDVESKEKAYKEEFDATMNDLDLLEDWARNNMNWDDVRSEAKLRTDVPEYFDYENAWVNPESVDLLDLDL